MAGKGSKPRPIEVDRKTYDDNWDRIFNKDKKKWWPCRVVWFYVLFTISSSWCDNKTIEKLKKFPVLFAGFWHRFEWAHYRDFRFQNPILKSEKMRFLDKLCRTVHDTPVKWKISYLNYIWITGEYSIACEIRTIKNTDIDHTRLIQFDLKWNRQGISIRRFL